MVGPGGAPPELVCRGGLPGQVALMASAACEQGPVAQAPRQSDWVGCARRRGPEVAWRGSEDVHGKWHTVCAPVVPRGLWSPESVIEDVLWYTVSQAVRQGRTVGVVRWGRSWAHGRGVVVAAAGLATWLGYRVHDAQQ